MTEEKVWLIIKCGYLRKELATYVYFLNEIDYREIIRNRKYPDEEAKIIFNFKVDYIGEDEELEIELPPMDWSII